MPCFGKDRPKDPQRPALPPRPAAAAHPATAHPATGPHPAGHPSAASEPPRKEEAKEKKEKKKKEKKHDPLDMTQAEVKKRLDRLESTARFLDSCWVMPCTCNRVRFGMDSLVGFVPVIGDFAGVIMALLYVGAICGVFSTPAHIKAQMFLNVAIDFCVGLVPVLGDIVDILFKANMRNHTLISRYVEERRSSGLPLEMGGLPVDPARPKVSAPASAYIPKVPFKPGAGRRVADLAVARANRE